MFLNKNNNDLIKELKEKGIDKNILDAMRKVARELFVNEVSSRYAYENIALPVECEQTISQPYEVAYMIDCLKLKNAYITTALKCVPPGDKPEIN